MSIISALRSALAGRPDQHPSPTNEQIADWLRTTPEALVAFEAAYSDFEDRSPVSENFFDVNSRQAAAMSRAGNGARAEADQEAVQNIVDGIVDALRHDPAALEAGPDAERSDGVSLDEVMALPERLRPQLTGTRVVRDAAEPAYPVLVAALERARQEQDDDQREQLLLGINAMLDTFDLDPVLYAALSRNPTSMGHWLGALERAVATTGFLRVPETTVRRVPLPILQMTRLGYGELTPTTMEIIDAWTREAFELDESKSYFIRTGTYSSKFDFRNAHVHDPAEVREIGRYLAYIQFQANQMASPLNQPGPIVGVSTTNEWVVREWIEDESGSPTIYHGMPLRTEFRCFVDCDADELLAVAPYWDPEVMLERFEQRADADDPDMRHDAIVFRAHLPVLMERFERLRSTVEQEVAAILPALELEGQWSLDIMLNDDAGEQLYAIDMAPAASSALSHHVPAGRLKKTSVDWMPRLTA
ncbi:hypothetical protein [Brevibacterium oceani]|uniref:hypothetical protein n=1 Tax=Brevibacterium oceani TaxID=358099 RepID=UPI0015E731F6|nr:hypothetical protein [Brevibacterium oceani]